MTFRTLRRTLLIAFGVGTLTSAAQLGLGYGLGILRSGRALDAVVDTVVVDAVVVDAVDAVDRWPAQLAWLAWFAVISAVVGAAVARRVTGSPDPATSGPHPSLATSGTGEAAGDQSPAWADRSPDAWADQASKAWTDQTPEARCDPSDGPGDRSPEGGRPAGLRAVDEPAGSASPVADRPAAEPTPAPSVEKPGIGVRVAVAVAAALGGAMVAPLSLVPAQTARLSANDPVLVAGVSAGLGALIGLLAALAVLGPRPLRWNLAAFAGAGWLLAIFSVIPSLGPGDPMPAVRLGVFDPAGLSTGLSQRIAIVTMPALALVIGAVTGGLARWRGYRLPVVASCGVVGAATLSLAYLIAGPGAGSHQTAPYWAALAAAATGLLGSVLAATIRWPVLADTRPPAEGAEKATAPPVAESDAATGIDSAPQTSPDTPTTPAAPTGPPAPSGIPSLPGHPESGRDDAGDTTVDLGRAPDAERPSRFSVATPPRPTTEDFWPSVPAAPTSPVSLGVGRSAAGTAAGFDRSGAEQGDSDQGDSAQRGSDRSASEQGGPDQGDSAQGDPGRVDLDRRDRTGRSWRRLFRRSGPDAPTPMAPEDPPTPTGSSDVLTDPTSTVTAVLTLDTGASGSEPGMSVDTGAREAGTDTGSSSTSTGSTGTGTGTGTGGTDTMTRAARARTTGTGMTSDAAPRDAGAAPETAAAPATGAATELIPPAKPARKPRTATRRIARGGRDGEPEPTVEESGDEPTETPGAAVPRQRDRRRRNRAEPELPAAEAEYVDWVSGLKGRAPRRAEPPRTNLPRAEPPRTNLPRTEPPRTNPPRTEPPRTEPPRTEPPRTDGSPSPLPSSGIRPD